MSHIYETPSCELSIHLKVEYGKALYITGDTEIFGFWNLSNSKRLDWNTVCHLILAFFRETYGPSKFQFMLFSTNTL